jgi:hypothetical protein
VGREGGTSPGYVPSTACLTRAPPNSHLRAAGSNPAQSRLDRKDAGRRHLQLRSSRHQPQRHLDAGRPERSQRGLDLPGVVQLITSTGSTVRFTNLPAGTTTDQLACNDYWTVGRTATLNSATTFVGTILASASINLVGATGTTVTGRLLAGNGATGDVTSNHDTIIRPTACATLPPGPGGETATTSTSTTLPPAAVPVPAKTPPAFTG